MGSQSDAKKLVGKVAIITGGGSGMGREIALEYAASGATLVIASHRADQNEEVAKECRDLGAEAIAVTANVTSEEEINTLARTTQEAFGRIDILFAGAGIAAPTPDGAVDMGLTMRDLTLEQWNRVINVNLTGVFLSARACIPFMVETGGGSIMSFTSATVREVNRPSPGVYVVSKWATEGFTNRLARELEEFNIRVNSVQPGGMTHTPMLGELYQAGRPADRHEARVVRPVALYLASEESRLVTGRMLVADQFNRERGIISCDCTRCTGWRPNPLEPEFYPIICT